MQVIFALGIPLLILAFFLWAIDTLGRIKVEQRAIASSLEQLHGKLDRLLGDDRPPRSLPSIPPHRRN